jgi:hypothetical protein
VAAVREGKTSRLFADSTKCGSRSGEVVVGSGKVWDGVEKERL